MIEPPAPLLRVVFDTNVVLPALVFCTGLSAQLCGLWQRSAIMLVVSRKTTAKLMRVVAYAKFNLNGNERGKLLTDYLPYAETAAGVQIPAADTPAYRDTTDQMFLDLAYSAKVDALVSGDEDPLTPRDQSPYFVIIRPADFLKQFPA